MTGLPAGQQPAAERAAVDASTAIDDDSEQGSNAVAGRLPTPGPSPRSPRGGGIFFSHGGCAPKPRPVHVRSDGEFACSWGCAPNPRPFHLRSDGEFACSWGCAPKPPPSPAPRGRGVFFLMGLRPQPPPSPLSGGSFLAETPRLRLGRAACPCGRAPHVRCGSGLPLCLRADRRRNGRVTLRTPLLPLHQPRSGGSGVLRATTQAHL